MGKGTSSSWPVSAERRAARQQAALARPVSSPAGDGSPASTDRKARASRLSPPK